MPFAIFFFLLPTSARLFFFFILNIYARARSTIRLNCSSRKNESICIRFVFDSFKLKIIYNINLRDILRFNRADIALAHAAALCYCTYSNIYISWRFAISASDSPIAANWKRKKKWWKKRHGAIVAAAASTTYMHNAHNGKSALSCVLCELNELRIVVRCFFPARFDMISFIRYLLLLSIWINCLGWVRGTHKYLQKWNDEFSKTRKARL